MSFDLDELTVAARVESSYTGSHRRVSPDALAPAPSPAPPRSPLVPDAVAAALARCDDVAVIGARRSTPAPTSCRPGSRGGSSARPPAQRRAAAPRARSRSPTRAPPIRRRPGSPSRSAPSPFSLSLTGPDATPARVLDALADATYVELAVPALASAPDADAPYLALSADLDGVFALRALALRAHGPRRPDHRLLGARRAVAAPHRRLRWTLLDALPTAGASAVIAAAASPSAAGAPPQLPIAPPSTISAALEHGESPPPAPSPPSAPPHQPTRGPATSSSSADALAASEASSRRDYSGCAARSGSAVSTPPGARAASATIEGAPARNQSAMTLSKIRQPNDDVGMNGQIGWP